MSESSDPSKPLLDLIFLALEHGLSSVDGGAGPLTPLLIAERAGKRELQRFVDEQLTDAVAHARRAGHKQATKGDLVAVAYDGFITVDGRKTDAVFVQAAESAAGPTHIFCQRYALGKGGKLKVIEEPIYADCLNGLFP